MVVLHSWGYSRKAEVNDRADRSENAQFRVGDTINNTPQRYCSTVCVCARRPQLPHLEFATTVLVGEVGNTTHILTRRTKCVARIHGT